MKYFWVSTLLSSPLIIYFMAQNIGFFDQFSLCLKTCMFYLVSATPPFLLLKIGRFFKLGLCDRYQVLAIFAELATYLDVLISPPPLNLLLKLKIAAFHIHGKNFLKVSYLDLSFRSHHSDTLPTDV